MNLIWRVHPDGPVHIAALTERFVKDPHEIVKAGDIVKVNVAEVNVIEVNVIEVNVIEVNVFEVDVARKRVALTMRLSDTEADRIKQTEVRRPREVQPRKQSSNKPADTKGMG